MTDLFQFPVIYYDMKLGKFRRYYGPHGGGHVFGEGASYYGDSQTKLALVQLSQSYFEKHLVEVGNIDEFGFAEHNGRGWIALPMEVEK